MAQNLVAQRDRIVVEAAVHVPHDRALVVVDSVGDIPLAEHQVADAVEERNVQLGRVLVEAVENLDVYGQRLGEVFLELELGRLFLELCDVGHQRLAGSAAR